MAIANLAKTIREMLSDAAAKARTGKSKRAQRTIKLSKSVVNVLRRYKAKHAEHKLKEGAAYLDTDLACARPDGTSMNPETVGGNFRHLHTTRAIGFLSQPAAYACNIADESGHKPEGCM